ncbi:hypothetical protein NHX12_006563 [Muraenolepis orangiensis]|uniref:Uncharacterized protein n=1 Tax=Muraenolepis orangiensis TaxID=630683 RepID=A0A9Q0DTS6_9TELE|nr:hypothetical protein NHX12_006563 [Muraenolepis orangiensis]
MTKIMCGEKAATQLNLVLLSNDTVSRRIGAIADDVKKTLIERIKSGRYYSIRLEETTNVADLANLTVYIRYEHDGAPQEDFLSTARDQNYSRAHIPAPGRVCAREWA